MDRYHHAGYYDGYQDEYCDNNDMDLYADAPLSDIQQFSDEPLGNGSEICNYMRPCLDLTLIYHTDPSPPLALEQDYQYANAKTLPYQAYGDNINQWRSNDSFQGSSSYEFGYPLEPG